MSTHVAPQRGAGFPEALIQARKRAGMTQVELATAIGSMQPIVSAWETKGTEPHPERVFAIERALRVAPGELAQHWGYVPVEARPTAEAGVYGDPDLTSEQRHMLLTMIAQCKTAAG